MYSQADLDFIREMKQSTSLGGVRDRTDSGEECKIRIIGRGENAFYQQGDRALLLEINAGYGVVFANSIRTWDNKKKVTAEEREVVIEVMTRLLRRLGFDEIHVVRK